MVLKFFKKHEILRFMVVGGLSAIVHYLIYILLLCIGLPYNLAYIISFTANLTCNFLGSSLFTFNTKPTISRAIKFAFSNGINFFIHILIFNLVVWLGISEKYAPVFSYTFAFPINYLLVRFSLKGISINLKRDRREE